MAVHHAKFDLEYEQINENIRFLADVRFKLLGLVATLDGAAIFVLARAGLAAAAEPTMAESQSDLTTVLLVAAFGLVVTLGMTLYDQRNSQLYNALVHRASQLETSFGIPSSPGGLRKLERGGQFRERPAKKRRFLIIASHDYALALIYGPILGAWLFPIMFAAGQLVAFEERYLKALAAVLACTAAIGATVRLMKLDQDELAQYREAARADGLSDNTQKVNRALATQAAETTTA